MEKMTFGLLGVLLTALIGCSHAQKPFKQFDCLLTNIKIYELFHFSSNIEKTKFEKESSHGDGHEGYGDHREKKGSGQYNMKIAHGSSSGDFQRNEKRNLQQDAGSYVMKIDPKSSPGDFYKEKRGRVKFNMKIAHGSSDGDFQRNEKRDLQQDAGSYVMKIDPKSSPGDFYKEKRGRVKFNMKIAHGSSDGDFQRNEKRDLQQDAGSYVMKIDLKSSPGDFYKEKRGRVKFNMKIAHGSSDGDFQRNEKRDLQQNAGSYVMKIDPKSSPGDFYKEKRANVKYNMKIAHGSSDGDFQRNEKRDLQQDAGSYVMKIDPKSSPGDFYKEKRGRVKFNMKIAHGSSDGDFQRNEKRDLQKDIGSYKMSIAYGSSEGNFQRQKKRNLQFKMQIALGSSNGEFQEQRKRNDVENKKIPMKIDSNVTEVDFDNKAKPFTIGNKWGSGLHSSVNINFRNYIDNLQVKSYTPRTWSDSLTTADVWLQFIKLFKLTSPSDTSDLFENWIKLLPLFTDNVRVYFLQQFPNLSMKESIEIMHTSPCFLDIFWPFHLEFGTMNQRLALLGITGKEETHKQKSLFFESLETIQHIKVPFAENRVIYSFDHSDLVDGLNRSGLLQNNKGFYDKGLHLFTQTESRQITEKVDAAFELIKETYPNLYKAINQLVACIAFYKSDARENIGGTVSSAIGIIWLDPSTPNDWTIPFYAEQIVHEFIHTSLFYADMVHGTYTDPTKLSEAKVTSSIRRQLRDYDKGFHAAYVSTGLIAFHTRAGYLKRAEQLATPLWSSLDDLVTVNRKTNILNESGNAMLKSMVDFMLATRMEH